MTLGFRRYDTMAGVPRTDGVLSSGYRVAFSLHRLEMIQTMGKVLVF